MHNADEALRPMTLRGSPLHDSRPRVLIVHNQPVLPAGHPDAVQETDVLETVVEVEKVLPPEAFEVTRFGYARDPRLLLDRVAEWRPDVVFNLFEGEADRTATEFYHAAVLEWACVPFTGSSAAALALARDKVRTKYLLRGAGLLTAPFLVLDEPRDLDWPHDWPAFVKPACQDASVGIDQGSVVMTPDELVERVRYVFDRYGGPVLVEQYVPGRELHVHVVEESGSRLRVMPPAEVRFQAGPGYWPVYTYEGKWNESSIEFRSTLLVGGVSLEGELGERVADVCAAAYRLLGMRDYARVDLRLTPAGEPFVLEVNPNPYLNSVILVEGLKAMDRQFPDFVQGLVRNALERR
jgi:D-alanine-D-alanine ligase